MGLPVGGVISALVSGSRKLDFPNKTLFTEQLSRRHFSALVAGSWQYRRHRPAQHRPWAHPA